MCMMVQTLLGDPTPPLLGLMVPCQRFEDWRPGGGGLREESGLQLYFFPIVPWSPSRVSGQPRPLTGQASSKVSTAWTRVGGSTLGFFAMIVTLNHLDVAPVLSPSTQSPEGTSLPLLGESPTCAVAEDSLSHLLDRLCLHPPSPVCTAVALTVPGAALALPPGVLHQEGSVLREETEAWAR